MDPVSITITFSEIPPETLDLMACGGFVGELAETGYRAYGDRAEWKNYLGRPMPQWQELPENIRSCWFAAATAILAGAVERSSTMPPPMCECGHAQHFHDVAEADGSGRRCCMTDCTCGDGS